MHKVYHAKIITQTLSCRFSPRALRAIVRANLAQDRLRGQIGHPEYHFDANHFVEGYTYIAQQRGRVLDALEDARPLPAWEAFGRLTHAAQDLYAHSNYVRLWLASRAQRGKRTPPPEQIDPLEDLILGSPALISGRIYYPWEILSFVPGLEPLMRRLLPPDSHTCMNLDTPKQGPLFAYALVAAKKRTIHEFEHTASLIQDTIGSQALKGFTDKGDY